MSVRKTQAQSPAFCCNIVPALLGRAAACPGGQGCQAMGKKAAASVPPKAASAVGSAKARRAATVAGDDRSAAGSTRPAASSGRAPKRIMKESEEATAAKKAKAPRLQAAAKAGEVLKCDPCESMSTDPSPESNPHPT